MWLQLARTVCFDYFWQLWPNWMKTVFFLGLVTVAQINEKNLYSLVLATLPKFNKNRVFFLVLVHMAAIGENSLFWRPLANLIILNVLANVVYLDENSVFLLVLGMCWQTCWKQSALACFSQFCPNLIKTACLHLLINVASTDFRFCGFACMDKCRETTKPLVFVNLSHIDQKKRKTRWFCSNCPKLAKTDFF